MAEDVNRLIADLRRLAREYPEIYKDEAKRTLILIAARFESEVVQRTPAGVGGASGLRGSIGATQPVVSAQGAKVSVGTPLEYAEPVEYGRKPGRRPPLDPLELWALRKLGVSPDEARSVGFALQYNIGKYGTEGAYMFRDGWAVMEGWADEQAGKLPQRIADRAMGVLR